MPPLVRDYVEYRKIDYLPSLGPTNLSESLRTFLPTDGLIELLGRTLESIFKKLNEHQTSGQEPASILLTGGYGVGKSHLLAVIYSLISQKGTLTSGLDDPRIQSHIAGLRQTDPLSIWLDLSEKTETALPELVLSLINEEHQRRFGAPIVDPSAISGIGSIKAHELITFNIAPERPTLLMIDGLSRRALNRDVQQLNEDIEFLSFIGYTSKSTRLLLIVAAHEDFFSPKSPLGIDNTLMAQTLENFRIEWIDRANLREIMGRHVFRKNPRQQQDLRKLYAFIKSKLPNFQYSESEFCDAYPFHPAIFDLAEKIKSKLPGFSLLDFVMTVYSKVASHRAISLVTIDTLFDRLEYEIKTNPNCERIYAAYQKLADQAVPRLDDRWKLWGKLLLKATFIYTLADRAPSVRDLTDALLLFEDSDTGLSYNVVGMVLAQMEKAVESGFSTTDDRLDRTYRLGIADLREELNKYLAAIAAQVADADPRIAETLLTGAQKYFPDWPLRQGISKPPSPAQTLLKANWRGTQRAGQVLCSERFHSKKYYPLRESEETISLSERLPHSPESQQVGTQPHTGGQAVTETSKRDWEDLEWLLWMEPIGLGPEEESKLKPQKATEVHWVPALPSVEELSLLKRILALQLTEKSTNIDFAAADLSALRDELNLDLSNLFRELYLNRGRIVTSAQIQAFNQGHLECQTFQTFLNYLLKPNLNQLYPLHPDFGGDILTENQVLILSRRLFAGQDPTDTEVQSLAGKFALPLGLVSRSDDVYELNLSITPPLFLTQISQYLETLETSEKPVSSIFEIVRRPPFGLTRTSLHLILAALVADGQIELFDPEANLAVSRENLLSLEKVGAFPSFKRIQSHKDYPSEVLTQWCRLITGRQELPDISSSRGRNAAMEALKEWHRGWKELGVARKLDSLPNEFLTTQMWRKLVWTKRRFEKVAETVEGIFEGQWTVIQSMGKVIELFAENVGLLEKSSRDLVELSHFIHWLENFMQARDYVLAAEKTDNPEIERERQALLDLIQSPHELVSSDKRSEFQKIFLSFKECFIDFYATRHDESLGPLGNFKLLEELQTSKDFRNLQLMTRLPLGDSSYLEHLDEWIAALQDYRCTLPVRDLLQDHCFCHCQFKLARPVEIAEVVKDLQKFLDLGISYHRQVIEHYRPLIEARLSSAGEKTPDPMLKSIRRLLDKGTSPELTQEIIDEINGIIDVQVSQQELASPLAMISPSGHFTKKQLQARIQQWLESLSDQEDLVFTLRDF